MRNLKKFYNKTIKFDLVNKFYYRNILVVPKITSIKFHINCRPANLNKLASSLLTLIFISKEKGILVTTKKPNLVLKIKKGNPTGCKADLINNELYFFLERLVIEIAPKLSNDINFTLPRQTKLKNTFSYNLKETTLFKEIKENYNMCLTKAKVNVNFIGSSNQINELFFLLQSFKIISEKIKIK